MTRRKIGDVDWRTLQFSPFWAFQVVAGIDGHIDQDERKAIRQRVDDVSPPDGPLATAILLELRADFDGVVSAWNADPRRATDGLKEAGLHPREGPREGSDRVCRDADGYRRPRGAR